MFEDGFPKELRRDVQSVSVRIPMRTYRNIKIGQSEQCCHWTLPDGEGIQFPYRIYYQDLLDLLQEGITPVQRTIYHCIFSRSCDGFVREKHIRAILSGPFPIWAAPYIVNVCDEYVVEILEAVCAGLENANTDSIKLLCHNNMKNFLNSHDQMISYWNAFYRHRCPRFKDYIGNELFTNYFGYTRSLERLRNKEDLPQADN